MQLALIVIGTAVALSIVMAAAWAIAVRSGQSGWIDAIWSFAVGGGGLLVALVPLDGWVAAPSRQYLVAALAAGWSLRLGLHIVSRTRKGGDDPRYAELKRDWGDNFRRRLFWFLQIQAAAAFLLVMTIGIAAHNPSPQLRVQDWLGALLLLGAILGEGVADRQLAQFAADRTNKGQVCDVGLWGLSRHPNYFFEWLGWVAYAVIAADISGGYAWGWLAIAGPAFMYWLLVHVSGIPPLEAHMLKSRGDAFRTYQKRVNAFWPGPQHAARQESRA